MFNKFKLGVIFLILFSCTHSTEPEEFSKMEFHYTVSPRWVDDTNRLNIFGNGTVQTSDWSGEFSQGILTTNQEESLIQLFSNFSQYDPKYSGSATDADDHILVYIYEGKPKSVSVYTLRHANIPGVSSNLFAALKNEDLLWLIFPMPLDRFP